MKPNADLPSELQRREGGFVIACQFMIGIIAAAPDFAKELMDFARKDALVS